MKSDFYKRACDKEGIELFFPNEKEQDYIQHKLMTEIELGKFHVESIIEHYLNISEEGN